MKNRKFTCYSFVAMSCFAFLLMVLQWDFAVAQKPLLAMESFASKNPIEKLYLHTDREGYFAGETIWFKAYSYSEHYPDTISTSLFVELVDKESKKVDSTVFPIMYSVAHGQIDIPAKLAPGAYVLRAYTHTMLNQPAFLFHKTIFVLAEKQRQATAEERTNDIRLQFFPESGHLIAGIKSTVAFKITDAKGLPVNENGVIRNQDGKVVCAFKSYHDGMGRFELTPELGERFVAQMETNPQKEFPLPTVNSSGVSIHLVPESNNIKYDVMHKTNNPEMQPAYMLVMMQHLQVAKLIFDGNQLQYPGILNTSSLPAGILHLTVFNKSDKPLAERICFIQQTEQLLDATIEVAAFSNKPREKNSFTVSLPEGTTGSFSVSVTDVGFLPLSERSGNILTSLLLTSDIRGYVHQPTWYFNQSNKDSAAIGLDNLMLTHGWSRFNWQKLPDEVSKPNSYKDPGFMTLAGQVTLRGRQKGVPNSDFILWEQPEDTSLFPQSISFTTDDNGNFSIDSIISFGSSRCMVSHVSQHKKKPIDVQVFKDSLHLRALVEPLEASFWYAYAGEYDYKSQTLTGMSNSFQYSTLQNVTVTRYKKSPIQLLDEKYSSPLFRSIAAKTYDLTNNAEIETAGINILDYIQSKVSGIKVVKKSDFTYMLIYRARGSLVYSSGRPIQMTVYVDEAEMPIEVIGRMPARDFALIKVFSNFIREPANGTGGVLALYSKKPEDQFFKTQAPEHAYFTHSGYTIQKEFYSPDYSEEPTSGKKTQDGRITLQWLPQILTGPGQNTFDISFYNSDYSKSYKVVVEGMTNDGKLLMIEKIISE